MALTVETFLDGYPEFKDPDGNDDLVGVKLEETRARLDTTTFGARFDEAHGALTAHELWSSAFGVSLRLDGAGATGKSKYLEKYEAIRKAVSVPLSMMVI